MHREDATVSHVFFVFVFYASKSKHFIDPRRHSPKIQKVYKENAYIQLDTNEGY